MDFEKKNIGQDVALGDHTHVPQEGTIEVYSPPPAVTPWKNVQDVFQKLTTVGVELRGLEPVSPENRRHTAYYHIMTLFGGSFLSILPYVRRSPDTKVKSQRKAYEKS